MINQHEHEENQRKDIKREIINLQNINLKIHFWIKFFGILQIISITLYLIVIIIEAIN